MPRPLTLTILLLLGCLGGAAQAQVQFKFLVPDAFERATVTDENGLLQWAEWPAEKCPTCAGTKTTKCAHCERFEDNQKCPECDMKKVAVCRTCAGTGSIPDPLQKVACPGCMGAGGFTCVTCDGRGIQKVQGSGDRVFPCVACKGEGAFECAICDGARLVDAPTVKPSLDAASAANLKKARTAVEAALKGVSAFTPSGKNARKDIKEFNKLLPKACIAVLPPLKESGKALENIMKGVFNGAQFMGHEEREANALTAWQKNHEYYLKFELHLLDLCIARAEANEKASGKKDE